MSFPSASWFAWLFLINMSCSFVQGADPSHDQAVDAMHRAVAFFRQKASIEGGYIFRWSEDLQLREGENKVGKTTAWIEPPGTPAVGRAYLEAYRLTEDPILLEAAMETADALMRGQMLSGGWTEQIEFDVEDRKRYAYRVDSDEVGKRTNITTFDDNKSQSAIRFLMQLDEQLERKNERLHEATEFALAAVLKAQYPNGAWPQKYDPAKELGAVKVLQASFPDSWSRTYPAIPYSHYYTLNDGTLCDLIETLFDAWDIYGDPRYLDAAKRGGEFLLLAQMPNPQPGWAQQYDRDMHPVWARKFEPPAITGGESQRIMRILLLLYRRTSDKRYFDAVGRALPYYQKILLPDGRLARFYELHTNRPLYFTRNYELTYSNEDMPTHYGFIVSSSLDRVEREFKELQTLATDQLWLPFKQKSVKLDSRLKQDTASAIDSLDKRGAWVESGKLKKYATTPAQRIISSSTFIQNLQTLAKFIAATR